MGRVIRFGGDGGGTVCAVDGLKEFTVKAKAFYYIVRFSYKEYILTGILALIRCKLLERRCFLTFQPFNVQTVAVALSFFPVR